MKNKNELESLLGKCKNCGARLVYDVKRSALYCDSCGSAFSVQDERNNKKHQLDDIALRNKNEVSNVVNVFKCQNCGADVPLKTFEISKSCPYCDSPNVIAIEEIKGLKPDKVVKFQFDKDEARKKFITFIRKKFFVPNAFKKNTSEQIITGFYFPTFTFDADASSKYVGELYSLERDRDNHIEKRYFHVEGIINTKHRNVLVESSSKLSQATLSYIMPYNLEQKVDFKQEYLLGYLAERHDNAFKVSFESSNRIMHASIENAIVDEYNADGIGEMKIVDKFSNRFYEYIILPVYFVKYEYKNKKYTTFMNGQTGKVGGSFPKSGLKISLVVSAVVLVIVLICLLSYYLQ